MPTRRQFLRRCSSAALTTSLFPASVLKAGPAPAIVASATVDYAAFARRAGTLFHVIEASGPGVFLRLVEVALLPASNAAAADAQNEKFSLIFSGPSNPALAQNTYTFDHPTIGRFEMFIVPVGQKELGLSFYEAIFNRPVGGATMPSPPPPSTSVAKRPTPVQINNNTQTQ